MEFVVITKVADPFDGTCGNLGYGFNAWVEVRHPTMEGDWTDGEYVPFFKYVLQNKEDFDKDLISLFTKIQTPVFYVGEILVLNENGREMIGAGRKPDKWDVDYEVFRNFEDAFQRAQEVDHDQR